MGKSKRRCEAHIYSSMQSARLHSKLPLARDGGTGSRGLRTANQLMQPSCLVHLWALWSGARRDTTRKAAAASSASTPTKMPKLTGPV